MTWATSWWALPSPWSAGLFLLGWTAGWLLLWRPRHLPPPWDPATRGSGRPAVAVVIPARNEAGSIAGLVRAMTAELRPGDELLVVDDRSTDATAAEARAAGATVVTAPEPPPGRLGKPHACSIGAAATTAPVLLFLDADVQPAPGLLDRLAAAGAEDPAAVVSVQPWHRTVRLVERCSLVFNVVELMGCRGFTVAGRRGHGGRPLAFGPVLACRREAYERVGGHAHPSVRAAVSEDIALGRAVGRVEVYMGGRDVALRMYPGGWRSLVQGWTKNVASGATAVPWWAALGSVAWVWSLAGGWLVSVWCYVMSALQLAVQARRAGRFGAVTPLVYPLLVLVFVALFVRSAVLIALRRPVRWKGRAVAPR